jgi:hypothetical protein
MESTLAKKKAHELTTEQVLRRVFKKPVRKALKAIAEQPESPKKPSKSVSRKTMKGI